MGRSCHVGHSSLGYIRRYDRFKREDRGEINRYHSSSKSRPESLQSEAALRKIDTVSTQSDTMCSSVLQPSSTLIQSLHALAALQGHLEKDNLYAPHLAWRCIDLSAGKACYPIGDIGWISDASDDFRERLMGLPIRVCSFISRQKTKVSMGLYQPLSATIFGSSEENICSEIFSTKFREAFPR